MRPHRDLVHSRTPLHEALPRLASRDITIRAGERLPQHDTASGYQESFVREVPHPDAKCEQRVLRRMAKERVSGCACWRKERWRDFAHPGDRQEEKRVVVGGREAGREEANEGRRDRKVEEAERSLTEQSEPVFFSMILPIVTGCCSSSYMKHAARIGETLQPER